MSEHTSSDDEPTTWTDDSRQRINISGERRSMSEGTRREAERRRPDSPSSSEGVDRDELARVDRKHGGDL